MNSVHLIHTALPFNMNCKIFSRQDCVAGLTTKGTLGPWIFTKWFKMLEYFTSQKHIGQNTLSLSFPFFPTPFPLCQKFESVGLRLRLVLEEPSALLDWELSWFTHFDESEEGRFGGEVEDEAWRQQDEKTFQLGGWSSNQLMSHYHHHQPNLSISLNSSFP